MKLSYIQQALVDLNDGENIEYETSFVTAANLALGHISRIVPEERTVLIETGAPALAIVGDVDLHGAYSASGVQAVTLRASGKGKLMAGDVQLAAWVSPGAYKDVRVYLPEAAELTVSFKDTVGRVCDLALWARDFGERERIPMFGGHVRYDMRALVPDFGGRLRVPVDAVTGVEVRRCFIDPPYVMVPYSYEGDLAVTYERRLQRISLDDVANDIDIDISPEHEDLVPLCMAYYIWLEDEPNKAAFFLARFNEAAALARQVHKRPGSDAVISYNGW